jgi:hypothetical protein
MDSQQEKPTPPPDRPSFFGLPASFHLWARVGATFWGGVLCQLHSLLAREPDDSTGSSS